MTQRDVSALAMAISGIVLILIIYAMYKAGRKDVLYGDEGRTKTVLQFGTAGIQAFLLALACWVCCIVKGIA